MSTGIQVSILAAVALLGSLVVWRIAGPPQRVADDEVELTTILNDWGGEVLWVDARKRSDWERNGLEGSVLVNLDPAEDFETMIAEALPRFAQTERAVVYCGTPGCGSSREVAKRLREYEVVPEVYGLFGGWQTLVSAGLVSGPAGDSK